MNRDMHLSLIGFMGSGKSTVGQAMATRLGRPFLDIDAEVERMLGMPIPQVFAELGESAFREAEQDALSDALRPNEPIVLATGGGTPCAEGAMEWMRRKSLVVALAPPLEVLLLRLEASLDTRPMLQGKTGQSLAQHVQRLMLTRAACYGQADVTWTQGEWTDALLDDALAQVRWRLEGS